MLFGVPRTNDIEALTWVGVQILQGEAWRATKRRYVDEMSDVEDDVRSFHQKRVQDNG